ncbi:MAG: hypothetical protein AABO41_05065 [Acidobacteriota bacterium]
MSNLNESFFSICIERFQFLIKRFECRRGAKRATGGVYTLTYQNSTTAVQVGLEWREQYVYVELCRLVDGRIKDNPVVIGPESQLTVFNLEDVLEIRNPELKLSAEHVARRLTVDALRKTLSHYARALEECASDILRGDFTLFDKLEHIVKTRAKEAAKTERDRQPYAVATEIAGERQRPAEVREPVGK